MQHVLVQQQTVFLGLLGPYAPDKIIELPTETTHLHTCLFTCCERTDSNTNVFDVPLRLLTTGLTFSGRVWH